mgnify:CR=1 FL=1
MSEHLAVFSLLLGWFFYHEKRYYVLAGFILFSALLFKSNYVYALFLFALLELYLAVKNKSFSPLYKSFLGLLIPIGICLFPYWQSDDLSTLYNAMISAPLAYADTDITTQLKTLLYLLPITITFLILDILRIINTRLKSLYNYFFITLTRRSESKKITGASYVFLSSSIIIFFFPNNIAVISLLIMTISDSLAALFGRIYGSIKIKNKTLEGSLAFFISSSIIILFSSSVNIYLGLMSALITTIVEIYSPINDNLSVPLAFGLSYISLVSISTGLGLL